MHMQGGGGEGGGGGGKAIKMLRSKNKGVGKMKFFFVVKIASFPASSLNMHDLRATNQ